MYYPTLPPRQTQRDVVGTFLGYNHNMRIGSGEFYDMENMSSNLFPLLSPRGQRGFYTGGSAIRAMVAKDQLCYVDGSYFVIGSSRYNMGLSPADKQLISMGAYVIILPDRKYINTVQPEERGDIAAKMTTTGPVTFSLCQINGSPYDITHTSDKEPEDLKSAKYWLDTGSKPNALKKYSTASGMWVSIATTYIKITAQGIGKQFQEGDGVEISGLKDTPLINHDGGGQIEDADIQAIDGNFLIRQKGDDYIIITGMLGTSRTLDNPVTVSRQMPLMDLCVESGNRLWGCRYGQNAKGETVNELYASKLGDFKNWNCFAGVSTDSYIASCGTDGPFTGAITHLGMPLFFKEECLHKVYGSMPANFTIQSTACRGVQRGSEKSLAIVGETLFYKSRMGVCAYDGSLPVEISQALGENLYSQAVGGSHGSKYYICMRDSGGKPHLFVYDASRNLWHKEDNLDAAAFCSYGNDMYVLDRADGQIKTLCGSGALDNSPVHWMVETGILGADLPDRKYISRIQFRVQLELESTVHVYIDYDSEQAWHFVCTMRGTRLGSFDIPIQPKRCDHFRLRIQGEGMAKIFSYSKTISQGSGNR